MKRETIKPWVWKTDYGTATVVTKPKHVAAVRELYKSGRIFLDTETTGLERNRVLRLVQVGWGKRVWLIDPIAMPELVHELMEPNLGLTFVCHNAPFDLLSLGLWHFGTRDDAFGGYDAKPIYKWMIDKALKGEVVDTMVAEQVRTSTPRFQGLAKLAALEGVPNSYEDAWNDNADELGYDHDTKYRAVSVNNKYWLRYSAHDVFQLRAVYKRNQEILDHPTCQLETKIAVLYGVLSHRGMYVDAQRLVKVWKEMSKDLDSKVKYLASQGIHKPKSTVQCANALKKAGAKLTEKTDTGRIKLDKYVLEALKDHKSDRVAFLAGRILQARSVQTDRSSLETISRESDGDRVYPNLSPIGALTSRSSCSTPNLQQLNKHEGDKRVRGVMMADYGHVMASVDFDGMELRTIADLTNDKRLIERLMGGADIHGEVTLQIYGKKFSPEERNKCKIGIFAMLYGATDSSVAKQAGCTIVEAEGLREAWRDLYPRCAKVTDRWIREARDTASTTLPSGWSPTIARNRKTGEVLAYRAVNYQIQGYAGFIFKQAGVQLAEAGLWRHVRMVVHDEFVLSLREGKAEGLIERVKAATVVKRKRMTYTTSGEIYGRHWGS